MIDWIGDKEPGFLIKRLLSDVAKEGLTKRQRGKGGHKAAVKLMSLEEIKEHINNLREPNFDLRTYDTKGYILRGSIRTDGHRIHLLAFKLRELQSVRYRRFPVDVLPRQITSTTGGTDYYLTEVRNVVKTKQDVAELWACPPDQIKILGLDLGQACVLGASALLPAQPGKARDLKMKGRADSMADSTTGDPCSNAFPALPITPTIFFNLAVKQKAVCQSTFKHRRWMEEQKAIVPKGAEQSIADIESSLPAARGEGASFTRFVEEFKKAEQRLDTFYNSKDNTFKKHKWDAQRARDGEYRIITDRLLRLVGGSIGCRRKDDNKVIIGIGLGQFSTKSRLSSLHESFQSYFLQKVRATLLSLLLLYF